MLLTVLDYFSLSIIIANVLPIANAFLPKYMSLIIDLHQYYGTSTICLVKTNENHHIEHHALSHISRGHHHKRILPLIISFNDIAKDSNVTYFKRGNRSLVIVFLASVEDVENFRKNTQKVDISHPIWLMIFTDSRDPSVCEYCKNPGRNIFGLRFNTEMLIACCNDHVIKEWWAVNENKTEVQNFGTWTAENGLKIFGKKALYARRKDINGTGLRIAIVTNSAFHFHGGRKIGGFFGAVVMELERIMNFKITTILEGDSFGNWDAKTKSWSGILDLVAKGKADLGVSEFTITNHRLNFVDFTLPLMDSRIRLYFKEVENPGIQLFGHFKAFHYQIWITIFLLMIVITIILIIIKAKTCCPNTIMSLFSEHFICIWGIFCQQGLVEFPSQVSLRIVYSSTFISALIVYAAYSASFISFLTVSSGASPFLTMEEYANDGSYGLIVLQNSSDWDLINFSPDPVMIKMKNLMKPKKYLPNNVEEALNQVCNEKIGLLTNEAAVKAGISRLTCKIVEIETGRMDSLGMIMPAKSQYTGIVNYHIQRFLETGLMDHLKKKYLTKPYSVEASLDSVSPGDMLSVYAILVTGIIISLFLLSCEKIYEQRRTLKLKWRNFKSKW